MLLPLPSGRASIFSVFPRVNHQAFVRRCRGKYRSIILCALYIHGVADLLLGLWKSCPFAYSSRYGWDEIIAHHTVLASCLLGEAFS